MPDISMCKNSICPLKEQCYRFKAKPSDLNQAYMQFVFFVDHEGKVSCEDFRQISSEGSVKS